MLLEYRICYLADPGGAMGAIASPLSVSLQYKIISLRINSLKCINIYTNNHTDIVHP